MSQNTPIVNAGLLYVNNLQVSRASTTTLTIAAGQARDSNNVMDLILSESVTLNAAVNGANGLDTGSLVASAHYYVYVIGSSKNLAPTATLLSTNGSQPVLPENYDSFRWIDMQLTNVSSQFVLTYNVGNGNVRTKRYDATINVLSGGAATALTLVNCLGALPPLAQNLLVSCDVGFTPASAGNTVSFAYPGSVSTSLINVSGSVAAVAQKVQMEILTGISSGNQQFQYINSAGACSTAVSVYGYTFNI